MVLKGMGFEEITQLGNGSAAWSCLKNRGADVVIASWDMTEMNGMALLKVVRSDPELAHVHIILIADSLTKAQVIEAGEAGVSDILLAPVPNSTLVTKIQTLLELGRDPQAAEVQRLYAKGLQLMENGQWENALDAFGRILTIYESAEIYYNMGYISTGPRRLRRSNPLFPQGHPDQQHLCPGL